jgi:hypothetical protein
MVVVAVASRMLLQPAEVVGKLTCQAACVQRVHDLVLSGRFHDVPTVEG